MLREGTGTISKPTAIEVASKAWNSCNFGKNLISGFETTGLFPVNKVKMLERVARSQKNGVKPGVAVAAWLRHRKKIQNDVLTLPPVNDAPKKRKYVNVEARLVTMEALHTEAQTTAASRSGTAPPTMVSTSDTADHLAAIPIIHGDRDAAQWRNSNYLGL